MIRFIRSRVFRFVRSRVCSFESFETEGWKVRAEVTSFEGLKPPAYWNLHFHGKCLPRSPLTGKHVCQENVSWKFVHLQPTNGACL